MQVGNSESPVTLETSRRCFCLDVDTVGDVSVEVTAVVHLVGLYDEAVIVSDHSV